MMTRMQFLINVIILFPLSMAVYAQDAEVIRGRVLNDHDHMPMPLANGFLANTSRGTITDSKGNFGLAGLKPGGYRLVLGRPPEIRYASQITVQ
jgi:hypothetical protein